MSARRPRVVVVAEAFPMRGGIATFAETISADPRLAQHYDMALLNTARTATREGGTLVWSNVTQALGDAVATWKASRHADVVHLQLVADPGLPMLRAVALCLAARLGGAKVIAHSHSATGNAGRPAIAGYGPRDRGLLRSFRLAHMVLTVSEVGAQTLRPLVGDTPVACVDNAIDVAAIAPRTPPAGTRPTVTFVGVICHRKGVDDLAAATAILHQRGIHDWRLVVAGGQGPTPTGEYQEMLAALDAAGVAGSAIGEQGRAQVEHLLAETDVFVLPSYLEGQPMAILEAMAAGIPVVATDTGAVPHLVEDGATGRVVEPGDVTGLADALQELIGSHELRLAWGKAARQRAELAHDLPVLSRRLRLAYAEVLAGRARQAALARRRRFERRARRQAQHA